MGCINSKKDISDINPNVYRVVHIDESSGAHWSGHLEISPKELILHRKGREPTKWSLQHLRRYGFDSDVFTFEAGRRCPTGEGIFAFKCRRAENLFHVMQSYIQGIALNDDINQQFALSSGNSSVTNRNRQSITNSRSNISIQNHNTNASYLIPSNRQATQSPSGVTHFSNASRSSDTFSADGNYLDPTPMRNNTGTRYSSGVRLSSIGSGPVSPEPNSPGSPNSFTIILEVTQLNQSQQHQQNYANSNIYHEFPFKSGENNNNLLQNKPSPDVPPQEPAPVIQMTSTLSANYCSASSIGIDDVQKYHNQSNACSSTDYDDSSRMYVNVTPGEMENIIRGGNSTPTTATVQNQMNFSFPKLSSTQSADLSSRCYENLDLNEKHTIKQSRYSKPDIFAKADLPPYGKRTENTVSTTPSGTDSEKSESGIHQVLIEGDRKVNYIVLDLDNMPSSNTSACVNAVNNSATETSLGSIAIASNVGNASTLSNSNTTVCSNNNSQIKSTTSMIAGTNLLPLENSKNVTLGYATIDFNKTVALSNSTIPSIELDNEGSRRTRHSSTAMRQSNSTSD